jgi:hypothetical protein
VSIRFDAALARSRDRVVGQCRIELTRAVASINAHDSYFGVFISVILISNDKVFPASG